MTKNYSASHIIYRFHRHILILTICLTVAAAALASRLHLDLNFYSLLPSHNKEVENFFTITDRMGDHSVLIAVVTVPREHDEEAATTFIDDFAARLAESPLIREVRYKNDGHDISSVLGTVIEHLSLFLHVGDAQRLASQLSDRGIRRQVEQNKRMLMTPFGIAAQDIITADPLGIGTVIENRFTQPGGTEINDGTAGYFRTADGSTYFLFIKPHRPPQDLPFSRNLMKTVNRLAHLSLTDRGLDAATDPTVSYTGGYPIAVSDEAITKQDIAVTVITSFLAVLLLFGISFRTTRVLFYVAVSLVVSILWTLGVTSVIFHKVNVLTCVFSCVLIGLGIDFAIHLVNRFFGSDKIDLEPPARLGETFRESGMGIIIGGITTAVAFYSLALSDFQGFRELGIVTGTGILICISVMMVVLPSLLFFFSGQTKSGRAITISTFGLEKLVRISTTFPKRILAFSLLAVLILSIMGFSISFDDNLRNFRPADSETFRLQDMVSEWMGASMARTMIVVQGPSESGVLKKSERIFHAMEDLKRGGTIGGVASINRLIATADEQEKTRRFIREAGRAFDMSRIHATFIMACGENGFITEGLYDDYFTKLRTALASADTVPPSALRETPLSPLIEPFIAGMDGDYAVVTYVSPLKDLWTGADTAAFRKIIAEKLAGTGMDEGDYILTGPNMLAGALKHVVFSNLRSSLLLAVLSIAGVLILYYRSVPLLLLSISPLLVGLATIAGIMVLTRLDFNFFNIVIIPMIVGIGIDDGVHLTNTFRQTAGSDVTSEIARTGRAVVLTSLTTLTGFGSLALSHYPGLRSMGYVAVIGISACLIASLVILPTVFALILKRRKAIRSGTTVNIS